MNKFDLISMAYSVAKKLLDETFQAKLDAIQERIKAAALTAGDHLEDLETLLQATITDARRDGEEIFTLALQIGEAFLDDDDPSERTRALHINNPMVGQGVLILKAKMEGANIG